MPCSAKFDNSASSLRRFPLFFAGLIGFFCSLPAPAQGGISTNGPFTIFRTGGSESLVTLAIPVSKVPTNSVLQFDFGFATAEPDASNTFFDSFSLTIEKQDHSTSALLFTADRSGLEWSPNAPGTLSLTNVPHTETNFASGVSGLPLPIQFAFSVSFALPPALTAGALNILFDLFDNLNQFASLAYVTGVRIESVTPVPPLALTLEAADEAGGPFATVFAAALDTSKRTFTLNNTGPRRFFRLAASRPTKIASVTMTEGGVVIQYNE